MAVLWDDYKFCLVYFAQSYNRKKKKNKLNCTLPQIYGILKK